MGVASWKGTGTDPRFCQLLYERSRCVKAGGPYAECACVAEPDQEATAEAEVADIHATFLRMLAPCSGDGQTKRANGKPHWHVDPGHEAALRRHLARWELDRGGVDDTSGASHLAHAAWRCLAIAWQEGYRP